MFYEQAQKDDKVAALKNILMHRPLIKPNSFVSADVKIEQSGSTALFNQLMKYGYLDKNGRLDADIDFYTLSQDVASMLQGQPDQDKKVRFVVDTLYRSAFPTSVGFFVGKERLTVSVTSSSKPHGVTTEAGAQAKYELVT